jgi:hypothetical protein
MLYRKQLLVVEKPEFGLNTFAHTRDELVDEIAEQVAFLWDEYAMADNESLTPESVHIKNALLNAMETRDAT